MLSFYCFKTTLRLLKFDISKQPITARALVERDLKRLFTTRWHTNMSYVTVSNVVWIVWDHRLIHLDC